jgi:hypothetical protein
MDFHLKNNQNLFLTPKQMAQHNKQKNAKHKFYEIFLIEHHEQKKEITKQ